MSTEVYLLNSIDDFKKNVPVNADFDFEIIRQYAYKVQVNELYAQFGVAFTDLLTSRLESNIPFPALAAQEEALYDKLAGFLSHMAMVKALPTLLVQVGPQGLYQKEGQNSKPVFQWQKTEFEDNHLELAYNCLEDAMEYLISERDMYLFFNWFESPEEESILGMFIRNAKTFHQYVPIGTSRRTFEALRPFINEVERFDIKPLLGKSLYDEIKTQLKSVSLTSENELLLKEIQGVVANAAILKSIGRLNVKLTSDGMMVTSFEATGTEYTKNRIPAQSDKISQLRKDCQEAANRYKGELLRFLYENIADYPLWTESDEYKALSDTDELNDSDSSSFII